MFENTDEAIIEALLMQEEKPARKIELGGDYYFKCYWLSCDADVNRYYNYCPICGQKLTFE